MNRNYFSKVEKDNGMCVFLVEGFCCNKEEETRKTRNGIFDPEEERYLYEMEKKTRFVGSSESRFSKMDISMNPLTRQPFENTELGKKESAFSIRSSVVQKPSS